MDVLSTLKPVDHDFSLKDHIYKVLRAAVLDMDIYAPDADLKLDERRLADQLNVSRTPIREALSRLEQERFIEIRARKGVFVKRKSLSEILDMIVVWAALESMAARLACLQASDVDISNLRRIGEKYGVDNVDGRLDEYSEANVRFHSAILHMSGNDLLVEHGEEVFAHLKPVRRRAMRDRKRTDRSIVDHGNIVDAIERRSADLASDLVREHTMRLHEYINGAWANLLEGNAA